MKTDHKTGEIAIYQSEDGRTRIDVKLENETVWLTQAQLCLLFGKAKSTISHHIKRIFTEGELIEDMVVRKFRTTTQHGAIPNKTQEQEVTLYNLDVIISVGYRVNSKSATTFRIWATHVLKDYLIKGYAINDRIISSKYDELSQLVKMLGRTLNRQEILSNDESRSLLDVVIDYTYALDTLDKYDYQTLEITRTTKEEKFRATYENAMLVINTLKEKFGESWLFGHEKDKSFHSSIGQEVMNRFTKNITCR